jgi:hypothetical protein
MSDWQNKDCVATVRSLRVALENNQAVTVAKTNSNFPPNLAFVLKDISLYGHIDPANTQ